MVARGLVVCVVLGLAGCSLNVDYKGTTFQCGADGACPDGYACLDDQCVLDGTARPAAACTSAVGAGVSHACAIRSDGTAWCWGSNDAGQLGDGTTMDRPQPVQATAPNLPRLTAIAGGLEHTCALGADKTVWCWGSNRFGQLGNSSTNDAHAPVPVSGIAAATAVVAGDHHSCAIDGGTVKCWGDNSLGQLGTTSNGGTSTSPSTTAVTAATALAAGSESTCAVDAGTAKCWGASGEGQLGIGANPVFTATPTAVKLPATDASATAVAVGENFSCVLTAKGSVYCAGLDEAHQLGVADDPGLKITPVQIQLPVQATAIVAGDELACAIDGDRHLWCWGSNDDGELADGTIVSRAAPGVAGFPDALAAAAGHGFVCVRSSDGLRCNGNNAIGQLGNGERSSTAAPQVVKGVTGATALALGDAFSCARLGDGSAQCWGRNDLGQLGDGTRTSRDQAVKVIGLTGADKIVAGQGHSCALVRGNVMCWGRNEHGQLGDGTREPRGVPRLVIAAAGSTAPLAGVTDLALGTSHTCAVLGTGDLKCWGDNAVKQLGVADTLNDHLAPVTVVMGNGTAFPDKFTAVAAGDVHTCGLIAPGAVWCWGSNAQFQLGTSPECNGADTGVQAPTKLDFPSAAVIAEIAIRRLSTCARDAAGHTWCWGPNGNGELGNGNQLGGCAPIAPMGKDPNLNMVGNQLAATQLAIGRQHACALDRSGAALCWGGNFRGQVGAPAYTDQLRESVASPYLLPTQVQGVTGARAIAAGDAHTCAVLGDATVACWGDNGDGALGGGPVRRTAPVAPVLACPK
ncbi:MAG TPA: hypothetical protein VFP84_00185 [Kofleriaceae bacterium]|nr:hypothetical protein [Kofleriaceae bacterium]